MIQLREAKMEQHFKTKKNKSHILVIVPGGYKEMSSIFADQ
jgi:hypothetical protein